MILTLKDCLQDYLYYVTVESCQKKNLTLDKGASIKDVPSKSRLFDTL